MDSTTTRRNDVDWLRVFASYLLLLFHTAMVFNPAPFYHIRNGEVSFVFLIVCGFISLWHMPLFFLLAGWSAHFSLRARGVRGYLGERVARLFVPLAAGCVLLMPPIKYLERRNGLDANYTGLYVDPSRQAEFHEVIPSGLPVAEPFNESFLDFLPTFFSDLSRFSWGHLWFVAYLFVFSLIYLPLFRRFLRGGAWLRLPSSPAWLYAPIVPLAIIQVTMRGRWPGLQNLVDDWANFAYYSTFMILGFLLARFPALESAVHRERKRALAIALGSTLLLLLGVLEVYESTAFILANTAVAGWCFVLSLLGWAKHSWSAPSRRLDYLRHSAFPVYLLHQSAIVLPGYLIIHLDLGPLVKFALLLTVATLSTLAAYHWLVRPYRLPRVLCGMKEVWAGRSATLPAAIALLISCWLVPLLPAAATQRAALNPLGLWYAEGGAAQVEVHACGDALCGRIVWLRSPYDENGCPLRDQHNPRRELRERGVLGLEILRGLRRSAEGQAVWGSGTIYDPGSGNDYRASLTAVAENILEIRGYIGVPLLGRTTRWFRVGAEQQMCTTATASADRDPPR